MRVRAILNRDGGTMKSADVEAFAALLSERFASAGRQLDARIVAGSELIEALDQAADDPDIEAIVAGGGDGTVSAAAAAAWRGDKALGVLPAGTMNLFARALGLPLDLEEAAAVLAEAPVRRSDIATANGRPFVHQYSIGIQPRMVRQRARFEYTSKLGKIAASTRAAWRTLVRPPSIMADVNGGATKRSGRYQFVMIANNTYGDGHMPYPDTLIGGELGVYLAPPLALWKNLRLTAALTFGASRDAPNLDAWTAPAVTLRVRGQGAKGKASIDGELIQIEPCVRIEIHPGALQVLAPVDCEALA